jgi:hypothetical protein
MQGDECPHCGEQLSSIRDVFCPHCREPLDEPQADAEQVDSPRRDSDLPIRFANFCLAVGQIVSVLGCVAAIVYSLILLFNVFPQSVSLGLLGLVGNVVGFFYSAAMFIVFSFVKRNK